jgi:hypothetical protein
MNSEVLSPLSQNLVTVLVFGRNPVPRARPIYLLDAQLNAMKSCWKQPTFFLPFFDHNFFFLSSLAPTVSLDFQNNSPSSLYLYTRRLFSSSKLFSSQPLHLFLWFVQHRLLARSHNWTIIPRKTSNNLSPSSSPEKHIATFITHSYCDDMRPSSKTRKLLTYV